ncbi:hypothetical protein BDQ12DRAFT_570665, partial [Crucibulum laeve]
AYYTMTISLNALATAMIIGRLAYQRRMIVVALGEEHGSYYTGIITMLIESAIILLIFDIWFAIEY